MARDDYLARAADAALVNWLPEAVKASIRSALAAGADPAEILRRARRVAPGSMTALGVEAYLEHLRGDDA